MKKSVRILATILILSFGLISTGSAQDEIRITKSKSLEFLGESKNAEVIVKSTSEYNYLKIAINCVLTEGDITIEIIDPDGEKQGNFTVKSDKSVKAGSNTVVEQRVSGSMTKNIGEPKQGDWIIKAIPSSAKGQAQYNIVQGFEPRLDMIGVKNIKE